MKHRGQTADPTGIRRLRESLKRMGAVVIAFSGGVDSTFLAAVAQEELGERAIAVTARSPIFSRAEQKEAGTLVRQLGIRHEWIESNDLRIPGFANNTVDRCYYCKRELFRRLKSVAKRHHIKVVADGTDTDDFQDDRPGLLAAREFGIVSPLADAGLSKKDIRRESRNMGLSTADKPSMACLATRFPYGSRITKTGLAAVNRVEEVLRQLGFRQVRVRYHGAIARIEIEQTQIRLLLSKTVRARVVEIAKASGFLYIALDLEGYRMGSMNEAKAGRTRGAKKRKVRSLTRRRRIRSKYRA